MHACTLYQQNRIHTPIQLGIVGHLRHFSPSNFAARRYKAQLAHIHFDNGTLGHDAKVGVQAAAGILLHAKDVQLEGRLQLWVRHIRLLHAQTGRSDEALVLGSLPGEVVADKRTFCDHSDFRGKENKQGKKGGRNG